MDSPPSYSAVYTYGTRIATRGATSRRTAEMCQPTTASTCAARDQRLDASGDPRGRARPVEDVQAQLAAEHAALRVDLLGGEACAQLARRAEQPGGAVQRDEQGDVDRGTCGRCLSRLLENVHRLVLGGGILPPVSIAEHGGDPPPVGHAEGLAGELAASLGRAEHVVTARLARVVQQEGCSVECWRALSSLADRDGHPMTQLAQAVLLPGPSVTRLVDRLVEDNLVYRRPDERDRRRILVYATERGLALHRALADRVERDRDALLAGATERDAERLVALLDRLG